MTHKRFLDKFTKRRHPAGSGSCVGEGRCHSTAIGDRGGGGGAGIAGANRRGLTRKGLG